MRFKKILAAVLAALTAVSFAACGGEEENGGGSGNMSAKGAPSDELKEAKIEFYENYGPAEQIVAKAMQSQIDHASKKNVNALKYSTRASWEEKWSDEFSEFYYEEEDLEKGEKLEGDPVTMNLTIKIKEEDETRINYTQWFFLYDGELLIPAGCVNMYEKDEEKEYENAERFYTMLDMWIYVIENGVLDIQFDPPKQIEEEEEKNKPENTAPTTKYDIYTGPADRNDEKADDSEARAKVNNLAEPAYTDAKADPEMIHRD